MNKGILFVLSSPSGGGKTTVLKRVMRDLPGLIFSVSHTTRLPRRGEENGRDYHFVSRDEFQAIQTTEPSGFLEWAEVHGNLYGTSRAEVEKHLQAGLDVLLDIDVQGAIQVQQGSNPVSIFIAPPSLRELESRLRKRGTENEEDLMLRLENAAREMTCIDKYMYLIVNDQLDEAVEALRSIIIAERCRRRRTRTGLPIALES